MERQSPSASFTYAALAETTRLVDIYLSVDENEPPEGFIRAYCFIGEGSMNLRRFGFAREYYLKALETFPKCRKDIFEDDEMVEMSEEGCVNLLKIYGNMGSYDVATGCMG